MSCPRFVVAYSEARTTIRRRIAKTVRDPKSPLAPRRPDPGFRNVTPIMQSMLPSRLSLGTTAPDSAAREFRSCTPRQNPEV